jgi:hypothetical protein
LPITPYTSVSISGYNSSPPSDDGSQTDANRVQWSKHKTKLADPIKAHTEAVNTNILSAVASIALKDWTAVTTTATIAESDWNNGLLQLGSTPVNYPAPSTFENGWYNYVFNGATDGHRHSGDGDELLHRGGRDIGEWRYNQARRRRQGHEHRYGVAGGGAR